MVWFPRKTALANSMLAAAVILNPKLTFAQPKAESGDLCDKAIYEASNATGVPTEILMAVARTESGKTVGGKFISWPWSINVGGQGHRFNTELSAIVYAKQVRGRTENFDVGCFQINYHWHGDNFENIESMFDPTQNAYYAARFLNSLRFEFGNWTLAVGAFHSRNYELSQRYLARYLPILSEIQGAAPESNSSVSTTRAENYFPLLRGQSKSSHGGSLFPQTTSRASNMFQPAEKMF